jgi:hypothetical protein
MTKDLNVFLEMNKINAEELMEALHLDIRETILKTVCEKMKKDKDFYIKTKKLFFSTSDIEATKKLVYSVCNCQLSDNDIIWLTKCIKAFFNKSDTRKAISTDEKKDILIIQKNRCAICGDIITIDNMHVDHIIPWDYVGDRLPDNRQGLCAKCNLSKSNHVAIAVSNIILHTEVKNEKNIFN